MARHDAANNNQFSFSDEDVKKLIAKQSFKPYLITIKPGEQPTAFVAYLNDLKTSNKVFRQQCIVRYNEHWFGLDLMRKEVGGKISVIMLDAANPFVKIAAFLFLLKQISVSCSIPFNILIIGSVENPLQRSNRDCTTFSWELLKWAKGKNDLHATLFNLLEKAPDQTIAKMQILPKIHKEGMSEAIIKQLKEAFLQS